MRVHFTESFVCVFVPICMHNGSLTYSWKLGIQGGSVDSLNSPGNCWKLVPKMDRWRWQKVGGTDKDHRESWWSYFQVAVGTALYQGLLIGEWHLCMPQSGWLIVETLGFVGKNNDGIGWPTRIFGDEFPWVGQPSIRQMGWNLDANRRGGWIGTGPCLPNVMW